VRLEGSLDAFSLPDIFSLLSMTKKTGGLHLRRADAHGVLWLGDGLITGGASDLARLSLGRRLAGSGHVADNNLSAAIDEVARNGDLAIARALRDSRAIDSGELHTVVYEHIIDTVFDLMRWSDGEFEFVVDEPNVDDVGVAREVEEIVTEARQRLDIWNAIDDRIADPSTVLSLTLDLADDPQVQRDEWELLALIDGRRTVGELVDIFGRGEYAVVVALAELVGRGLVRTDDTEGVAAMVRRQNLVAALEPEYGSTPSTPDANSKTRGETNEVAEPGQSVDRRTEPRVNRGRRAGDGSRTPAPETTEQDEATDTDEQVAAVSSIPRSPRRPRDSAPVTPERPEPFLPSRGPDHPEPLAAVMAGGGAAPAAMPAASIERDPSVNKSLLLRLIAGVRGL
jgi:hypothetical protein